MERKPASSALNLSLMQPANDNPVRMTVASSIGYGQDAAEILATLAP
jgi:hypothetical protein